MEEDISLDGQREQTLEDWVRAIKNLSESRHIIAKATKLATTNAHLASDLFAYLLRTLKKVSKTCGENASVLTTIILSRLAISSDGKQFSIWWIPSAKYQKAWTMKTASIFSL